MNNLQYIPGQRWVSNNEPEAGLGIVVDCAHRRVTVSFPAIGEQRTYALDNAPLSRVRYNVGDRIRLNDDTPLTVTQLHEEGGLISYVGMTDSDEERIIEELDLDSFVQFSKPQDRLFAGQIDTLRRFDVRQQTLSHWRRHQQSTVLGLQGARVQLLPHQFYIASEVASRHAPRVLLADEVGLGKTIEAGLIIHQQLVSGRSSRVLIVVPDSLIHQWLVEMLRRFNLMFTILDEPRCEALTEHDDAPGDTNPFESAQLVLCPLSFLTGNPPRRDQAIEAGWDLMVVDEAHHLQWSEEQVSEAYRCVEALAREVQGLLLLTATPEQLGMESHFARLRLLDPDRYYDLAAFCEEESSYRRVSELVEQIKADDFAKKLPGSNFLQAELSHYLGEPAVESLLEQLSAEDSSSVVDGLIRTLLDRHGTGRVLFRNTRDAVSGFPERQLVPHKLPAPDSYLSAASGASLLDQLRPERLLGEAWLASDPRVEWLTKWLQANRDKKVLLICAEASTAEALESHLNLRFGVQSAVFHEGLSLVQRDRAAAYFADDDENAQLLVCSEIGSEGRNFQFAHHLVLFDLPLNPDLLEQRIGRLDRIGQKYNVQIHVPFYDGTAQFGLLQWYHDGLNAFERVCPVGSAVYQQVSSELEQCLLSGDLTALKTVVTRTHTITEAALYEYQQGRDRLLEISSCNPARASKVIQAVADAESPKVLADYMEAVFDLYGVEQNHHSADAVILEPGDHLQCDSFPWLPEEGLTATFQREKALSREDMHFLSWEHPMVSGAMEMILNGDFGNTSVCTVKLPPLKPGGLLLEAVYVMRCSAPKNLQLQNYLPMSTVRVVVETSGKDLSKVLTAEHVSRLAQKVSKTTAQELVRHARPQITGLIERTQQLVEPQQKQLIADAVARMEQKTSAELERLQALAEVNPNIRKDEIDYMDASRQQLRNHLESAELWLDSIRVAVTV